MNLNKNSKFIFIVLLVSHYSVFSQSVKIGSQEWTNKNFDKIVFKNGDSIPEVKNQEEWENSVNEGKPAWCYFSFNMENNPTYGKLYNWYAITDERNLIPEGWHIPSDSEWKTLSNYIGGDNIAGGKLKSREGWLDHQNGTNDFGFNAFPAGSIDMFGLCADFGYMTYYWTSSTFHSDEGSAWFYCLYSNKITRNFCHKGKGFSIRLVKD